MLDVLSSKRSNRLEERWQRNRSAVMRLVIAVLATVAAAWLGYQFWRLLFQPGAEGALDLRQRYLELHTWFSERKAYGELVTAVYPPASYVLLWPFLIWSSFTAVRWIWALTALFALVWLAAILVREGAAVSRMDRTFLILMPLSMYATGATLGNGQLLVHLMPVLLTSLLLLRGRPSWYEELAAALMFVIALTKPSATAPFFWIVLIGLGNWRAAVYITVGYLGLTLWASVYQSGSPLDLVREWLQQAEVGVEWGNERGGYANQGRWLSRVELGHWTTPVSSIALLMAGIGTYFIRRSDFWVLLGVTAIIARFWTYHAWYDDLLLLLPAVALFRIATEGGSARLRISAGFLLGCMVFSLLAPGGLYLLPEPWRSVYVGFQLAVWLLVFLFLIVLARRQHRARPDSVRHAAFL